METTAGRHASTVQMDLALDQPRAGKATEAAAVQPRQPGLAIELSHSAAEPASSDADALVSAARGAIRTPARLNRVGQKD
jgi:hypothetical protein